MINTTIFFYRIMDTNCADITFDSLCYDVIHLINMYIPPYILRQFVFLSKTLYNAINNKFFQQEYCKHYITSNMELLPQGTSGARLLLRELFRIKDGFYLGFMGYETYIRKNYRCYLPKRVRIGYPILNGAIAAGRLNIVSDLKSYGVITSVAHDDSFMQAVRNKHFEVIELMCGEMGRSYLMPRILEDAIITANLPVLCYLMDESDNEHINGYESLIRKAVEAGQLAVLKYLIYRKNPSIYVIQRTNELTITNIEIKQFLVGYLEREKFRM